MSGFVVWMTGLSGAGKSTLASLLTQELSLRGIHVECLDGDEVRKNLSHGLGFSREDRDRNVRRIGYVARMVARSGSCAITAAISPYRALRDEIRSKTENFLEVYCECPIEVLTERDPKGLYKRALAGELKNFTGVDDPYEAPNNAEVVVRTDRSTPAECIAQIIAGLEERGLLSNREGKAALPRPFGGEVFEARDATDDELRDLAFTVDVDADVASNVRAVANGYFSPIAGFMSERESVKVEKGSALEGGTPWWNMPFLLPLPPNSPEPDAGALIAVSTAGRRFSLARVDRVWGEPGARRIEGPIEGILPGARASMSARGIRKRARDGGWRSLACVFPESGPNAASRASLVTAESLADWVLVAVRDEFVDGWERALCDTTHKVTIVSLPTNFPVTDERARLVVQRSLGASANLLID